MEIEAGELKQKIDRGDNMYILDVRTPENTRDGKSHMIDLKILLSYLLIS